MRGLIRSALLIGPLASASQGLAQSPTLSEAVREVPKGREVQLLVLANTARECSGLPVPEVRITEAPGSGTIIVRYVVWAVAENTHRCAGRQVPGLSVYYHPNAGFTGLDRVRIETGAPGEPSQKGQTLNLAVIP